MSNAVATKDERRPVQVMDLIEAALTRPEVTPEKLLGLLEVQRQVRRDEEERAFNEAMNLAQAEMEPVRKDANNPQTKSKYASYSALDVALRPVYTKYGFSVSFNTEDCPRENEIRVVAEVARGGFSKHYRMDIPADGKGAKGGDVMTKTHAAMSAVSYGRRGLTSMIWNVATSDRAGDDDGNRADASDFLSAAQVQKLQSMIVDRGADLTKLLAYLKVPRLEDIYANKYGAVVAVIDQKWPEK